MPMTDTHRPIKTVTTATTAITLVFASSISIFAMTGCDRTEPASLTNGVAVDIAQTDPLVAGESVGDANMDDNLSPNVDVEIEKLNTIDPTLNAENTGSADGVDASSAPAQSPQQISQSQNLVAEKPSIVIIDGIDSNNTADGNNRPEVTLANAMNALYYGDAKASATYYQTDIPDFANQLAVTQTAFQKTVKNIVIKQVTTNDTGDVATIQGEVNLVGIDTPEPAQYTLQKVDGAWKILG